MAIAFSMICEEPLDYFSLTGSCTVWESRPENPTNIIRTNEPWGVTFEWTQSEGLCFGLSGTWILDCFLEKWGPGEGPPLRTYTQQFENRNPHTYTKRANQDPIGDINEGTYKISTRIRLLGPGNHPLPVISMGEGPMLDFYKAVFP